MGFSANKHQQVNLDDNFNTLSDRTKKFILNSWAGRFADNIFPAINEERFAKLYSKNSFSRPNTPVNIVVAALLLKEVLRLTDDELLLNILTDVKYQYALHTTSFKDQPVSDRTLSRFRKRLYDHEIETGEDLLKDEMIAIADKMVAFMKISPSLKRMDSIMVASSCKKMSRLEIVYTCISNLSRRIQADGMEKILTPRLSLYLQDEHKNNTLYRSKTEDLELNLEKAIEDAASLARISAVAYKETDEYKMLTRVLREQAQFDKDGSVKPKDKKEIGTDSLQNPSDPDATFRRKAGESHKGYVGNLVETMDENGAIITQFGYEQNIHSDSAFCKEVVDELGMQEETVTIITDGAYGGEENIRNAREKNIHLVTTTLLGKDPSVVLGDFVIDENEHEVRYCPEWRVPVKTSYNEKQDSYRVLFLKEHCDTCKNRKACKVKNQKKYAMVTITPKTVARAQYLKKLSTEEYKELTRKRNAVEGIPSVLRRRYQVDKMPVRGFLRSKMWFTLKIGAINVKRVLAKVLSPSFFSIQNDFSKSLTMKFHIFKARLSTQVA